MTKIRCLNCGSIIESKHRHDFVSCPCRAESHNKVWSAINQIMELVEDYEASVKDHNFKHQLSCIITEMFGTGVAIDGGDAYTRIIGDEYEVVND